MSKLEELKQEADELGLTYNKNIGEEKLQIKLNEYYAKEAATADIPEVKEEIEEAPIEVAQKSHKEVIKELERENMKTSVVMLTMVDKREASTATDAYFSNGSVAMRVPLDVWVEMPNILIAQAKAARALLHKKDDKAGSVPVHSPKYVIEYKN